MGTHVCHLAAAVRLCCRMYKLYELKRYTLLYCLPSPGIAEVKLSTGALLLVHERRPASVTCQLLSLPGAQVGHWGTAVVGQQGGVSAVMHLCGSSVQVMYAQCALCVCVPSGPVCCTQVCSRASLLHTGVLQG